MTSAESLPLLPPSARRVSWALFLLVFGTNLYFNHGGDWNQNTRLDLTRAIVEAHTFRIDNYAANTWDKCLLNGHAYCDKAPGLSFMAVPAYFVLYHGGRLLGAAPDGDLFNIITVYLTRALTVYLIAAFGAVLLFRLAYALSENLSAAALATVGYALGTLSLVYGMLFFGHIVVAVFCLAAFYLVFALKHGHAGRSATLRTAVWVGLLLGLSVVSEYPSAILAGIIALYALPVLRKHILIAGLIAAIPLLGLLLYNYACFGQWLTLGYSGVEQVFPRMAQGVYGVTWPTLSALYGLTFSPYRGLFVFSPFLVLGLFGLAYMAQQRRFRRECAVFALSAVALLFFIASYAYWHGGGCIGPRHMVPVMPYLAAAAVFTIAKAGRLSFFVVLASACMILAMLIVGHTLSSQAPDPIFTLLRKFIHGRVSVSDYPVFARNDTIPARWNSFNLGELIGLRGTATVLPIAFFWYAMGKWLRSLVRSADAPRLAATAQTDARTRRRWQPT